MIFGIVLIIFGLIIIAGGFVPICKKKKDMGFYAGLAIVVGMNLIFFGISFMAMMI